MGLLGLQRGKERGQALGAVISTCSILGGGNGVSQLQGNIGSPQGPVEGDAGCTDQHTAPQEPLLPPGTPIPMGPPPFPSPGSQRWCSPTTPRPACAPALHALSLSQGLLPLLLPARNKSPSSTNLGSQRSCLRCHLLPMDWAASGMLGIFSQARGVCLGKLAGTGGFGPSGFQCPPGHNPTLTPCPSDGS